MSRIKLYFFLCLAVIISCTPVPITGRHQLDLVPEKEIFSLSYQSYQEVLQSNEIVQSQEAAMVKKVGKTIQAAVETYFSDKNRSKLLENYRWEYNLIKDSTVNAWCMPGGKVGVHTGILPITQNETGLAVVMGHEIAHAIANHGSERMSQMLLVQLGGIALSEALDKQPEQTQKLAMAAFGLGAQIGAILPYSRLHEKEADNLGLIFMAMAGYNPRESIDFWKRMSALKSDAAQPPEFLSTHPSDESRIKSLQEMIPEAINYYKGSD